MVVCKECSKPFLSEPLQHPFNYKLLWCPYCADYFEGEKKEMKDKVVVDGVLLTREQIESAYNELCSSKGKPGSIFSWAHVSKGIVVSDKNAELLGKHYWPHDWKTRYIGIVFEDGRAIGIPHSADITWLGE